MHNSTYTRINIYTWYGTEYREEHNQLISEGSEYTHVVFTYYTNKLDIKTITGTLQILQVQGNAGPKLDGKWKLNTTDNPCLYPVCQENTADLNNCSIYKNNRNIKKALIVPKWVGGGDDTNDD